MHRVKVVVLLSIAVFISPLVVGQHFDVDVDTLQSKINPGDGEKQLFNITVTNNGDTTHKFDIKLQATNTWYNGPYPYTLQLAPDETGYSLVYINPDPEAIAGRKGVELTVQSNDEDVVKRPSFSVSRDTDVLITAFTTGSDRYNPGEAVEVTATVKNVVNRELRENEYQAVFSFGGQTKEVAFSDLDPGEEETKTVSFPLGQFDSGVMDVVLTVQDLDGTAHVSKTANIRVETMENVETTQQESFNGLAATTVLAAENTGNAAADSATMSAAVPSYLSYFVSFDVKPSSQTAADGIITYIWELGSLQPGERQTVRYSINYWVPVAILLVLLVTAAVAIREYRRPALRKKSFRKNGKHSVHLIVRNRSGQILDNVVVRDFVPGIATLIEKFDSSPPEKIRQGEEGTEIEWKLGRMNPGEERILTYKISPQVEVEGHITLPSARLEYKNGNKQKKRDSHHARADFS